jgi:putative transposase
MAGPDQVLRYLSRYSHRVAIGNERIVAFHDGEVSFRYRIGGEETAPESSPCPRLISCSAFCCTRCPAVSSASVTTVFWPMGSAPGSSPGRVHCSNSPPRPSPSSPRPKTGGRSIRGSPDVIRSCARCATSAASASRTRSTPRQPRHRAPHEPPRRTHAAVDSSGAGLRVRGALRAYEFRLFRHPIRLLHPRSWLPRVASGGLLLPDRPLGAGRSAETEAYNPPTD